MRKIRLWTPFLIQYASFGAIFAAMLIMAWVTWVLGPQRGFLDESVLWWQSLTYKLVFPGLILGYITAVGNGNRWTPTRKKRMAARQRD